MDDSVDIQQLEHFFSDFQIYRLRPGNIIRLVRYALGLSSREFAKKTGLSQTDITRCELGQKPIPEKKLWVFLERLNSVCPIQCYSSYTITRAFYDKDKYGNPAPMPNKNENFKLDLSTCFQESVFRENYYKLILSSSLYSDYNGNSFHGIGVLRKLLWQVLHEKKYKYSKENDLIINDKVLSFIAFLLGLINYEQALDKKFFKKNILPQKNNIVEKFYNHNAFPFRLSSPSKENLWLIDFFMLMFQSFSIDFEERFVSVSLFPDIQPPENVTMCWESGLVFNFKKSNDTYHQ